MVKNFDEVLKKVKSLETKTVSVAVAQDEPVLHAVKAAKEQGIANAILVGDEEKIREIAKGMNMDLSGFEIVNEPNVKKAALKAVQIVSEGKADMVMKGMLDTATFLRSVLNKEVGLRQGKQLMSHVSVFDIPGVGLDRLLFLTDVAFNMYPELQDKVQIVNNAVKLAHAVGIECPKVAPVCAVEVVNPNMPATVDAAILSKMNERGQIKGCIVDGPLALDNAISLEAAKHKNITGPVAGQADIMLLPNIEAGNIMYKTLAFTTKNQRGGLLVGTKAPVILTSRSDTFETKMNSIALAALVAAHNKLA